MGHKYHFYCSQIYLGNYRKVEKQSFRNEIRPDNSSVGSSYEPGEVPGSLVKEHKPWACGEDLRAREQGLRTQCVFHGKEEEQLCQDRDLCP